MNWSIKFKQPNHNLYGYSTDSIFKFVGIIRRKAGHIYLFKQTADNTKATGVHPPLGVAAGRIDKLHEFRHGRSRASDP